ncbi:Rab geranylgeranyltransferase [Ceratobasidium sp. 394]|nr:Rab geranylgeranyltransferase [Ceratobasidium sp. 394]
MLDRDSRNFHAWNYRRYVLACMPESDRRPPRSELAYTTRKIEQNFSNFSAWHQRTKVWGVIWAEKPETEASAKQEEFEFVRNALWTDPGDQSAWLYHRWLIGQASCNLSSYHFEAFSYFTLRPYAYTLELRACGSIGLSADGTSTFE